ncbi:MAG: M23 family metallopeptidase [Parabacteroides sp.]|nr:M23 family metallopeptidase [Parabacteroides sp.]
MYKLFIVIIALGIQTLSAQQLQQPFDFPVLLSGSFGELRSNHFHSGIDFKTQGVEGKPIHAVQSGYVSRISVSPWGYGNALYLTHPDGTTTVYAHLQRFTPAIAQYIKEQQYAQESFNVNLFPEPEQFPFEQGEIIAYSGNTGSSAGPHLHFEVRDTQSEEILDPIEYFKAEITDTRAPQIKGILVCPIEGKGVVNGSRKKLELKNQAKTTPTKIEAWGEIGLAVKAYDYMDNTTNIYGIKEITLYLEDEVIFHSYLDRFAFDETRFLNSFVDYEEWKERKSFYMRSFVEPGNRLRFIESQDQGIIRIDEERQYHLTYLLADAFGNEVEQTIQIEGKEQEIPEIEQTNRELFHWYSENRFGAKSIRMTIPKGNLYNNLYFRYVVKEDSVAIADTHILHNTPVPLHKSAQLSLRLQIDTLENKQQYGIVRIEKGRTSWIGGDYRNGWIDGEIKELGTYSIRQDTKAPTITPIDSKNWIVKQRFSFRLSDNLSGVATYRGEIDGQYVLFEMNSKSVISYKFDKERLKRGKHKLQLTVVDAAGNRSKHTHIFVW